MSHCPHGRPKLHEDDPCLCAAFTERCAHCRRSMVARPDGDDLCTWCRERAESEGQAFAWRETDHELGEDREEIQS